MDYGIGSTFKYTKQRSSYAGGDSGAVSGAPRIASGGGGQASPTSGVGRKSQSGNVENSLMALDFGGYTQQIGNHADRIYDEGDETFKNLSVFFIKNQTEATKAGLQAQDDYDGWQGDFYNTLKRFSHLGTTSEEMKKIIETQERGGEMLSRALEGNLGKEEARQYLKDKISTHEYYETSNVQDYIDFLSVEDLEEVLDKKMLDPNSMDAQNELTKKIYGLETNKEGFATYKGERIDNVGMQDSKLYVEMFGGEIKYLDKEPVKYNDNENVSFEKAFKYVQGVEYNEEKITQYMEAAEMLGLVEEPVQIIQAFSQLALSQPSMKGVFDTYVEYYGSEETARSELNSYMQSLIEKGYNFFGATKLYINENNELVKEYGLPDDAAVIPLDKEPNFIPKEMARDYIQAFDEELQEATKTEEKPGKSIEDYRTDYALSYLEAFSDTKEIQDALSAYREGQMGAPELISTMGTILTTTLTYALAVPTGGMSLVPAVMLTGGVGAATKVTMKGTDTINTNRQYTLGDAWRDGLSGFAQGAVLPLAGGAANFAGAKTASLLNGLTKTKAGAVLVRLASGTVGGAAAGGTYSSITSGTNYLLYTENPTLDGFLEKVGKDTLSGMLAGGASGFVTTGVSLLKGFKPPKGYDPSRTRSVTTEDGLTAKGYFDKQGNPLAMDIDAKEFMDALAKKNQFMELPPNAKNGLIGNVETIRLTKEGTLQLIQAVQDTSTGQIFARPGIMQGGMTVYSAGGTTQSLGQVAFGQTFASVQLPDPNAFSGAVAQNAGQGIMTLYNPDLLGVAENLPLIGNSSNLTTLANSLTAAPNGLAAMPKYTVPVASDSIPALEGALTSAVLPKNQVIAPPSTGNDVGESLSASVLGGSKIDEVLRGIDSAKQFPQNKEYLSLIKGIPEFKNLIGVKNTDGQGLNWHTLRVLKTAVSSSGYDSLSDAGKIKLKFAAVLHDFGKVTGLDDQHPVRSADLAKEILGRYNPPEGVTNDIAGLIENHHWLENFNQPDITPEAITKIAERFGSWENYEISKILAEADLKSTGGGLWEKFGEALSEERQVPLVDALEKLYGPPPQELYWPHNPPQALVSTTQQNQTLTPAGTQNWQYSDYHSSAQGMKAKQAEKNGLHLINRVTRLGKSVSEYSDSEILDIWSRRLYDRPLNDMPEIRQEYMSRFNEICKRHTVELPEGKVLMRTIDLVPSHNNSGEFFIGPPDGNGGSWPAAAAEVTFDENGTIPQGVLDRVIDDKLAPFRKDASYNPDSLSDSTLYIVERPSNGKISGFDWSKTGKVESDIPEEVSGFGSVAFRRESVDGYSTERTISGDTKFESTREEVYPTPLSILGKDGKQLYFNLRIVFITPVQ